MNGLQNETEIFMKKLILGMTILILSLMFVGCDNDNGNKTETCNHTWIVNSETDSDGWKITTPANGCANGEKTRTCSDCGDTQKQVVNGNGQHTWGNWSDWTITKQPTENDTGTKTRTRACSICGEVETETIPKTGGVQTGTIRIIITEIPNGTPLYISNNQSIVLIMNPQGSGDFFGVGHNDKNGTVTFEIENVIIGKYPQITISFAGGSLSVFQKDIVIGENIIPASDFGLVSDPVGTITIVWNYTREYFVGKEVLFFIDGIETSKGFVDENKKATFEYEGIQGNFNIIAIKCDDYFLIYQSVQINFGHNEISGGYWTGPPELDY